MRPRTLAEVARRARAGEDGFDRALREFLDAFYEATAAARPAMLADEPETVGRIEDAYIAAAAEHLSLRFDLDTPAWTEAPARFLREPYFAGQMEGLKALLIVHSPLAFRRRLIFVSADALSRPRDRAA